MAAKPTFQPPRLGHLDVCFVYMYTASEPHALNVIVTYKHVVGFIVVIINIILYNINNIIYKIYFNYYTASYYYITL